MTENELHDLRNRAANLVRLLDEWEPGLFTWSGAVSDAWFNVVQWAPEAARNRLNHHD